MKITDTLFNIGSTSKNIFTKLNDDLCLVVKAMPQEDAKLKEYIDGIKAARDAGVNIAEVLDYELIPNTTHAFTNCSYTKGVFLERLAKGTSNEHYYEIVNSSKDYDINIKAATYLVALHNYVALIESRANMNQEHYDKFVQDCLKLEEYGITIDPKPTNFFIDPKEGVTIIDPIPKRPSDNLATNEHFSEYVMFAFLGYGRPTLYIDREDYSVVPMNLKQRIIMAYAQIDQKVAVALRKANIEPDYIRAALNKSVYKYEFKKITDGDVFDYLNKACAYEKERKKEEAPAGEDTITLTWKREQQ